MARTLSTAAKAAIFSAFTDKAVIALVTITHSDLGTPIRLAANSVDIVSGGDTYTAWPMELAFMSDEEGTPPRASIVIDNVDRTIIAQLRALDEPPDVTLEAVLADTPDTIEVSQPNLRFDQMTYNAQTIQIDLALDYYLTEPASAVQFDPSRFPGLF